MPTKDSPQRQASKKAYYLSHKEEIDLYRKEYRITHKEKEKIRSQKYFEIHKEKIKPRQRTYEMTHKEEIKARVKAKHLALRNEIITAYGGKCVCCGETEPLFLSVDHINGGGNKHKKEIGGNFYRWLKNNGYPSGFQILCFNCNMAKGFYGVCPHETIRSKEKERIQ